MNYEEVYYQTEICLNHIKKRLKENFIHARCERLRTIEQSNYLWEKFISKYKKEAFELIKDSLSKPYVIYRVNRYYKI